MATAALSFDRFQLLSDAECAERIVAAKATLGNRVTLLGHHYQRNDV